MTPISVWILGDQLLQKHPAVEEATRLASPEAVTIVLIESLARRQRQPYQRKKLVLLLSAMRHYAQALQRQGFAVAYLQAPTFLEGLQQHVTQAKPSQLVTMAASSYPGRQFQQELAGKLGLPVTIVDNTQFLVGRFNPIPDPEAGKRHVLEGFYREMRRHFDILMDGEDPVGDQWNFDQQNRKRLPESAQPTQPVSFTPDDMTSAVMEEVAALPSGLGSVDGFRYAVTRSQALDALQDFVANRLPNFGDYQDALTRRSHVVYHSLLSPYLNLGLLEPLELAQAAEAAYRAGDAPLNAAEGFIRQLIGWREFMYWQYWRQMPGMLDKNAWEANRSLPAFFWDGDTDMACMHYALSRALDTGYNHHIERLMVLSNFLMLTGVNPREANDWFLSVYIDAYDWVMPPNVIGMGLNADGGLTATKPYIASANYINKMGDHCSACPFAHTKRHGKNACPFNYLYWNFILEHKERLQQNSRTSRNVLGLRHLDEDERQRVRAMATQFLHSL